TPVEPEQEPTFWEKVSDEFHESIEYFGEDAQDFLFNIIENLPYLILWAVILIIAIIIVSVIIKKIKKKYGKALSDRFGKIFVKKNKPEAATATNTADDNKAENCIETVSKGNKENE
ncbi:MAG: DUF4349 domain-containing protein, partial [Lachnospiraceae bacterium]|nr:DUF4349 domain-containing protein [Lachnospiraceae bacterium]